MSGKRTEWVSQQIAQRFPTYTQLPVESRRLLKYTLLLHLFRAIGSTELRDVYKRELGDSYNLTNLVHLRKGILVSYLFNIKTLMYAYNVVDEEVYHEKFVPHVGPMERKLICYVKRNNGLSHQLRKYEREGYKCVTPRGFQITMEQLYDETEVWLMKFIYRKLRFILNMESLEPQDLRNELFIAGIRGLIHMYPRVESRLHATNIVKSAMQHYGNNLIKKHSTNKRVTLQRENDGTFVTKKISIDNFAPGKSATVATGVSLLSSLSGEPITAYGDTPSALSLEDIREDKVLTERLSVTNVLDGSTTKKKAFVSILMGIEDKEFVTWLRTNHHLSKDQDYDEYYERALRSQKGVAKLIRQVSDHLAIRQSVANNYLEELKVQLG